MKQNLCQVKNIIIRRRLGAKSMRLSINAKGEIILTLPFFCREQTAFSFLDKHQNWIKQQQEHLLKRLKFQPNMTITLLGQELKIVHKTDSHFPTYIQDNTLYVCGDVDFIHRRITDFIKKQTEYYIDINARNLARKIGCSVNRITLKDTTSRWGSCSGKGNLNFCWRLGLAPLFVLDYIIAHEVAHLKEMNHGPDFWKLVATLNSDRSSAEIWLRRNGSTLR